MDWNMVATYALVGAVLGIINGLFTAKLERKIAIRRLIIFCQGWVVGAVIMTAFVSSKRIGGHILGSVVETLLIYVVGRLVWHIKNRKRSHATVVR